MKTPAAKLSEIPSGTMKQVSVDGTEVLLARVGDTCHAIGAHCTHYGAPLVDGALVGDRIVCPWHHACFNARSGKMEEPPALDSLPSFAVTVDGDDIFIDVPQDAPDRCAPDMTVADVTNDPRVFVIVGGGAAGYMAAQTLRTEGFAGRIVMITSEERTPYDRPNLSKDYLHGHADPEWMPLRPEEFYSEHDIEIVRGRTAAEVEIGTKQLHLDTGETMNYDSLLVATGGIPRELKVEGGDLAGIHVLRSFDSADEIIRDTDGAKSAIVIGASFIAMEGASSLRQRGLEVTVVAPDVTPFERTLGREIGQMFRQVHEENGVKFKLGSGVARFENSDGRLSIVLNDGESLTADLVLVGVGVRPATDILSNVELHKDGGVIADQNLRIANGVFAAGDIVHFPDARTGDTTRIEHWRTALQQGMTAAGNMLGRNEPFVGVPFFWTTQFDATLNYVGHATRWDEIVVNGSVGERDFLAFYVADGRVLAAAGMNRDHELAVLQALMHNGQGPPVEELRSADVTRALDQAASTLA